VSKGFQGLGRWVSKGVFERGAALKEVSSFPSEIGKLGCLDGKQKKESSRDTSWKEPGPGKEQASHGVMIVRGR